MGKTYGNIANTYAGFVVNLYGIANIVFDGYRAGVTLKDNAHIVRGTNLMQTTVYVG